jgi:hypothetical protein
MDTLRDKVFLDKLWNDGGNGINTTQEFGGTRINYTIVDEDNDGGIPNHSDDANETFKFTGNQSSYVFQEDRRANQFHMGGTANQIVIEQFGSDETVTGLDKANLVLLNDKTSAPVGQPNDKGGWTLEFFDKATGNHITIDTKESAHNWAWFLNNCLK